MKKRFLNKTVLITGGTRGIGHATAKEFINEGAFVYITGKSKSTAQDAKAKLGRQAVGIQSDVCKEKDILKLYNFISQNNIKLDVLFANAGTLELNVFGETLYNTYNKLFNVNVKGLFFTVQSMLPLMTSNSSVILNASIASIRSIKNLSLYNATKASVVSFAKSWSSELQGRKIRVNSISPGFIDTSFFKNCIDIEDRGKYIKTRFPVERLGLPREVAKAVLFLSSFEDSSYINGINLIIDGGTIRKW